MHRPYTFTANCFRRYVDAVGSSAANCYRTIRRCGRVICSELFQTIRRCGRVICSELLQDDTSKRSGHLQRTVTGRYVDAVGSSAANCYRTIRRSGRDICSGIVGAVHAPPLHVRGHITSCSSEYPAGSSSTSRPYRCACALPVSAPSRVSARNSAYPCQDSVPR